MKDLTRKLKSLLIAIMVLLICWQILSLAINKPFLPGPIASFKAFFMELANGKIVKHSLVSIYRVLASMVISFALALPLGIVMGRNKRVDRLLTPVTYILYPIPKVVFLPVIVVLFGLGNFPKIFLISLVLFFQLLVVVRDAAKEVEDEYVYSARALGMNNGLILKHVVLPLCIPEAITSLRVGIGTAIAILFFSETFASMNGLGYYISDMMSRRNYDNMFAGILAMTIIGLGLYGILYVLEDILTAWAEDSHKTRESK